LKTGEVEELQMHSESQCLAWQCEHVCHASEQHLLDDINKRLSVMQGVSNDSKVAVDVGQHCGASLLENMSGGNEKTEEDKRESVDDLGRCWGRVAVACSRWQQRH
jgi:hypothetical protein